MPSTIPLPASTPTPSTYTSTSSQTHHLPMAPSSITFIPRLLPTGPCFASCACKTYWPATYNSPVMCACGHHACYHDQTPPATSLPLPSSSIPQPSTSMSISDRLSAIESTLELIRRSPATSIQARLTALEMAIGDLPERVEVAEERIEQLEIHSVELENQIETVERILSEDEEEGMDMDRRLRTPLSTPPPLYKEVQSPIQGRTSLLHPVIVREAPLIIIPAKRGSAGSEGVEEIEVQVEFKRGRRH